MEAVLGGCGVLMPCVCLFGSCPVVPCSAVLCIVALCCATFCCAGASCGPAYTIGQCNMRTLCLSCAVLCCAVLNWPAAESACSLQLSCASRDQLLLRCCHPAHPVYIELLWVLPWVGNIPHYQLPTVPSTTQQVLAIKAQTACAHAALLQGPCFAAVGEVIQHDLAR